MVANERNAREEIRPKDCACHWPSGCNYFRPISAGHVSPDIHRVGCTSRSRSAVRGRGGLRHHPLPSFGGSIGFSAIRHPNIPKPATHYPPTNLPYRGILCGAGLLAAVLLLPQARPLAQYSGTQNSATPSYTYGSGTPPPSSGSSPSMSYFQTGAVGTLQYSGGLNFQVPLSLTGHAFALRYTTSTNSGTNSASVMGIITTGSGNTLSPLSLAVAAPLPGNGFNLSTSDWWLVDTTAGLEPPHKTLELVNSAWLAQSGVPNRYFALPDTRAGHALIAGFAAGGWTPVTAGPLVGSANGYQSLHYFVGWATGCAGSSAQYLLVADRTTNARRWA